MPDDKSTDWGLEIRRFRRTRLLKQAVMAEMLNVDQATVSRWERNLTMPDLAAQRHLRDLIRRPVSDEFLLRHVTRVSLGQFVVSNVERVLQVVSAGYAAAHGLAQDAMPGQRTHSMYTEEGEQIWQASHQHGFYRGDVASVTLVSRVHSLSGHRRNIPVKVLWSPIRLGDGAVILHGERIDLPEQEFAAHLASNGGPVRIVPMDALVR
jgi:transcriptional regulator with XRE-family HTH domain